MKGDVVDEAELLDAARSGDEHAYEALVGPHRSDLEAIRRQAGVTPIQWRRLHSRSTAGHAEPRNASTPSPGDANKPAPKRGPNSAFFDP